MVNELLIPLAAQFLMQLMHLMLLIDNVNRVTNGVGRLFDRFDALLTAVKDGINARITAIQAQIAHHSDVIWGRTGEIEALKIQAAKDREINAANEAKIKQQDRIIKGLQKHMDQQDKIIKELQQAAILHPQANVELMQPTAAMINQEHQDHSTTNNFNGNEPTYMISVNHYYNGMLIDNSVNNGTIDNSVNNGTINNSTTNTTNHNQNGAAANAARVNQGQQNLNEEEIAANQTAAAPRTRVVAVPLTRQGTRCVTCENRLRYEKPRCGKHTHSANTEEVTFYD